MKYLLVLALLVGCNNSKEQSSSGYKYEFYSAHHLGVVKCKEFSNDMNLRDCENLQGRKFKRVYRPTNVIEIGE